MRRLLVFGLGTTFIQVTIFYSFLFIVHWFAAAIALQTSNDESILSYELLFSAILFAMIVLAQNLLAAVINNKKATYVLMAIATVVYIAALLDLGISLTFRSGLCFVFSLLVIGVKTKIDERLQ